ncbi:MAG TPA: amidophosphoribosyltransferase [Armatimonadota bacterium]|nr:amidophosphoribosyltransferase [Armatimonadota bacterium]
MSISNDPKSGQANSAAGSDKLVSDMALTDFNDDAVRDGCGVFGVYAPNHDVARLTFFGLYALQHRGQESAGIAVTDGETLGLVRDMGLVSQVFDEDALSSLHGYAAIGHTRYSTTGSSLVCNAQPITVETAFGPMALAHNGNLINTTELREMLEATGVTFETTTDSEVIARMIAYESANQPSIVEAVRAAMPQMKGAYSVILLTHDGVYGFRDPWGIRPLCLGVLSDEYYVLASEPCALDVVGATFIQEISAGELVAIGADHNISFHILIKDAKPSMCMFEFIYVARPDSHIYGRSLHLSRRRMGQELAREHPVEADIVISVPDSGTPAAIGFAEASKIPYGEGLIKNRYIHRTFIHPDQRLRELGVRMKLNPLREALSGKRVVLVDDSIVRGTTTRNIVKMLREAGATQVHLRISSPPYRWPCFYGIDTDNRNQLLAARLPDLEAVCKHIGADTLGYLSIEGLIRSVSLPKNIFCLACLNGEYPIEIPTELAVSKFALEDAPKDQLTLTAALP